MEKLGNVSVVIPTLGGITLLKTIEKINMGSLVPEEILICIPVSFSDRVKNISIGNVKVVFTDCLGQVAQRAEGFKLASCKYVLQLDDDITMDYHCLEELMFLMESRIDKCAISPALHFIITNQTVYQKPSNSLLNRVYYFLINGSTGYKPGTITKAGTEIGADITQNASRIIETEWLPGGCILHKRENLVLENYYPLQGKAYCEDLFHSMLITKKNITLYIATKAIIWIDDPRKQKLSLVSKLCNIYSDFRARHLYLKKKTGSRLRMLIYYCLVVIITISKSIKSSKQVM